MSSAVQRQRVLSLYRQILRLGRKWEAKNPADTAEERRTILAEAKEKFHANKATSTQKPSSSTSCNGNAIKPSFPSGIEFDGTSEIRETFIRRFFAGAKIDDDLLQSMLSFLSGDADAISSFCDTVLCSPLFDQFPPRLSYQKSILKSFVKELEASGSEVTDALYTALTSCMRDGADFSYRIYLTSKGDQVLSIVRESNQQLCFGTTGLSLWQASCDLANLLVNFVDMSNYHVLELGAGCGLTGLSVARAYPTATVTLTDYDEKVLDQLQHNIEENFAATASERVRVQSLNWKEFDDNCISTPPDVVIAADVVYDRTLLPSLCNVIAKSLGRKKSTAFGLVASTLRDPDTLKAFRDEIAKTSMAIVEEVICQFGAVRFADGTRIAAPSLFPHTASFESPTIIFRLALV